MRQPADQVIRQPAVKSGTAYDLEPIRKGSGIRHPASGIRRRQAALPPYSSPIGPRIFFFSDRTFFSFSRSSFAPRGTLVFRRAFWT